MARQEGPTRAPRPSSRGVLVALVSGRSVHATLPVPARPEVSLGRAADAGIRIADESVSRNHALLRIGEEMTIEDLGSSNHTFLNNEKLAPGRPAKLAAGDVLRLGDVLVMLHWAAPATDEALGMTGDGSVVVVAAAMARLHELIQQIAPTDMSVLVLGETGVGKEVVARRLHALSRRSAKRFVGLNCAAFSEQLLESELFGHEKGAFTGADQVKPGLFESAEGGTVFLDEVAEMPHPLQAKLLRVIEERAVLRVGSLQTRPIDVRFVTATNREIEAELAAGRFRKDLFYRLAGFTLSVPPLRERVEEIEPLARKFARDAAASRARHEPQFTPEALEILQRHPWPGNVRELKNVVERAMVLNQGGSIEMSHILLDPIPFAQASAQEARDDTPGPLRRPLTTTDTGERDRIIQALDACAGNQTRAAETLRISRRSLLLKLDKYGIPRPRKGTT